MTLRTVAFGDARAGIWGAAWSPHPDLPSFAVVGPEPAVVAPAELQAGASRAGEWRIVGDGLELTIAPEAVQGDDPDREPFDQLVTVRGQLLGDRPREVSARGCRSERADALEAGHFQLVRGVCAYFAPGEGLALVAVRPRRAAGHGAETVTATLFSGGQAQPVAEPRLSTAYTQDGRPLRATLELWLVGDDERGRPGEESEPQYPRRAAGESSGQGVSDELGQLAVQVQPFRWRAEGRDGAGVYALARAR